MMTTQRKNVKLKKLRNFILTLQPNATDTQPIRQTGRQRERERSKTEKEKEMRKGNKIMLKADMVCL